MSRYQTTVSVDGPGFDADEYSVRGELYTEMTGRGLSAFVDGEPEILVDDEWRALDEAGVSRADRARIVDALSEEALEDDSDECDREERDERRAEGWR
jgi:hypothetical protein